MNVSFPPPQSPDTAFAFFGAPNITVAISQTVQGIAINPVTRTAALADANATGLNGPQIDLLNSLDQSISSITFRSGNGSTSGPQGCTVFTTCPNSPELLGTSSVAFQPYSNSLVSYNPQLNQLSVSNPVTQSRYAVTSIGSPQTVLPAVPVTVTGTSVAQNLTVFGGVAVDP